MRSLSQVYGLENQFWMGGRLATQLEEISSDPSVLADGNFWAIVITFEGEMTFARFATVEDAQFPESEWSSISTQWHSSCDHDGYISYVNAIREEIAAGGVYQVNACYELTNKLAHPDQSLSGLFSQLIDKNPAPYAQYLHLPDLEIASASPERLVSRRGQAITTSPIKGTIRSDEQIFCLLYTSPSPRD